MTYSPDITLGQILTLSVMMGLPLIGLIGAWVTTRNRISEIDGGVRRLEAEVKADLAKHERSLDANYIMINDLRLHVEVTCVKKDDLKSVEVRLGDKMDKVEHSIRNAFMEMVRAIRPDRQRGDQ